MEGLRSYPVADIKIHLSVSRQGTEAASGGASRLQEALRRVGSVASWGLPVHLYVPMDLVAEFQALFAASIQQSGVERLYGYRKDLERPLANSVGCFGRGLGYSRVLWLDKKRGAA